MAKKAAKDIRAVIHLECTVCREAGRPGVARYDTRKNKRNTTKRLELRKYCRYDKMHTLFREVKK